MGMIHNYVIKLVCMYVSKMSSSRSLNKPLVQKIKTHSSESCGQSKLGQATTTSELPYK